MNTALEGGEWSAARPGRTLPPGKDPVPIVQETGWAPGPVWTGAENLAPPGFDPQTVQPVASRFIDYATRPTFITYITETSRAREFSVIMVCCTPKHVGET